MTIAVSAGVFGSGATVTLGAGLTGQPAKSTAFDPSQQSKFLSTGRTGQAESEVAKLSSQHVTFSGQAASFFAFDPFQHVINAAGAGLCVVTGAATLASFAPPAQALNRKKAASKASNRSKSHFSHPHIPAPAAGTAAAGIAAAAATGAAAAATGAACTGAAVAAMGAALIGATGGGGGGAALIGAAFTGTAAFLTSFALAAAAPANPATATVPAARGFTFGLGFTLGFALGLGLGLGFAAALTGAAAFLTTVFLTFVTFGFAALGLAAGRRRVPIR